MPSYGFYVSNYYDNDCVHKYTPDVKLNRTWGEPCTDPGQFNIVHNIVTDADGWVYVADRENHRIQIFDGNGKYETQWNNLHRACGLYMHDAKNPTFFVGELGPFLAIHRRYPNLGPRVTILDKKGEFQACLGPERASTEPGGFVAPHTLAIDSRGDLYVGEVANAAWPSVFLEPTPANVRSFQKFKKLS